MTRLWQPEALSWRPLAAGAPVRFVYVDEAGRSDNEPLTVVVGAIVSPDADYLAVEDGLSRMKAKVPPRYRSGFVSHATSIWSNPKFREGWSRKERFEFLHGMLAIAADNSIPLVMAGVKRTNPNHSEDTMSRADYHHMYAFGLCLAHADKYLREECGANETAVVVAENLPEMHKHLKAFFSNIKKSGLKFEATQKTHRHATALPRVEHGPIEHQITRIKDTVHFAAKDESPMLQISDVWAFAYRRLLMNGKGASDLLRDFVGDDWIRDRLEVWAEAKFGSDLLAIKRA